MKAKEYADQLGENPTIAEITTLIQAFFNETVEIGKARGIVFNRAAISLLNEQNAKWKALARLRPILPPDAFERIVERSMPTVWAIWKKF